MTTVDRSKKETSTQGLFPEYSPYPSRSDINRRGPIFSNEFTRYRPKQPKVESVITKPANQKQREALTDVTYSRGINDVDFKVESEESSGADDLSNVVNRDQIIYEQESENTTDGTIVSVLEKYSWKISGFSECSRPCGGGWFYLILLVGHNTPNKFHLCYHVNRPVSALNYHTI